MIECRPAADGNVHVTFRLPNLNAAERVSVVGEFNAWCPAANPMERRGDEVVTEVVLPAGRTYRFRYLLDDDRWVNDWAADSYTPNELGGDDSVLDLTRPVTNESAQRRTSLMVSRRRWDRTARRRSTHRAARPRR